MADNVVQFPDKKGANLKIKTQMLRPQLQERQLRTDRGRGPGDA